MKLFLSGLEINIIQYNQILPTSNPAENNVTFPGNENVFPQAKVFFTIELCVAVGISAGLMVLHVSKKLLFSENISTFCLCGNSTDIIESPLIQFCQNIIIILKKNSEKVFYFSDQARASVMYQMNGT